MFVDIFDDHDRLFSQLDCIIIIRRPSICISWLISMPRQKSFFHIHIHEQEHIQYLEKSYRNGWLKNWYTKISKDVTNIWCFIWSFCIRYDICVVDLIYEFNHRVMPSCLLCHACVINMWPLWHKNGIYFIVSLCPHAIELSSSVKIENFLWRWNITEYLDLLVNRLFCMVVFVKAENRGLPNASLYIFLFSRMLLFLFVWKIWFFRQHTRM